MIDIDTVSSAQQPGTITLNPSSGPIWKTRIMITGEGWEDYPNVYLTAIWSENKPELNVEIEDWKNRPDLHEIGDFRTSGEFFQYFTIPYSPNEIYICVAYENSARGSLYGILAYAQFTVTNSEPQGNDVSIEDKYGLPKYTNVEKPENAVNMGTLVQPEGEVFIYSANWQEWKGPITGEAIVFQGDRILTKANSRARIRFDVPPHRDTVDISHTSVLYIPAARARCSRSQLCA